MTHARQTICTDDGDCPCQVFTPSIGRGPWPAIIVYMDAGGIRPAIEAMCRRLAEAGYVVLLPDLFYRYGPYAPFVPKEVFAGDFREVLGPLMATTDNLRAAADTRALLAYLDARDDVSGGRVGAVGFCMGGGMAIAAAGTWPGRFAAVASFHGGRLATDQPTSPHLFASRIQAELYVAAAEHDASYPPDMAERFEAALKEAAVRYVAESYPAAHGWMKPDFPSTTTSRRSAAGRRCWNCSAASCRPDEPGIIGSLPSGYLQENHAGRWGRRGARRHPPVDRTQVRSGTLRPGPDERGDHVGDAARE